MEKILTNVRIIDPSQKIDEIGNIIIDEKGKIKSIGKKTKLSDASKTAEKIDLQGNIAGITEWLKWNRLVLNTVSGMNILWDYTPICEIHF